MKHQKVYAHMPDGKTLILWVTDGRVTKIQRMPQEDAQ